MTVIFILLVFFLAVGVLASTNRRWPYVVLSAGILAFILYIYIT